MAGSPRKWRTMVLERESLTRQGITSVLRADQRFEFSGECDCIQSALELIRSRLPDLVIVGTSTLGDAGTRWVKDIHAAFMNVRIVAIGAPGHLEAAYALLRAGAQGVISRDRAIQELCSTAAAVLNGGGLRLCLSGISPDVEKGLAPTLTAREQEVLGLVAQGKDSRQISGVLGISPKTASNHISSVRDKLGFRTAEEALDWAVHFGLLNS